MKNIGNNILDNLLHKRRRYVAPAVFMEEMEEEGEMLAGTIPEAEATSPGGDGTNNPLGEDELAKKNIIEDIWFNDDESSAVSNENDW